MTAKDKVRRTAFLFVGAIGESSVRVVPGMSGGRGKVTEGRVAVYRGAVATCPVCGDDVANLAEHFVVLADVSDGRHIMWLNRNVTKKAVDAEELARLLAGDATSSERLRR